MTFQELNMDGNTGRVIGTAWVSRGLFEGKPIRYLSINVYDLDKIGRPYPSGYVTSYNIPMFQLGGGLGETFREAQELHNKQ